MLKEDKYKLIFQNGKVPDDDIILIYRIFAQVNRNEKDLTQIKDKETFWKSICDYLMKEGELAKLVEKSTQSPDFSDENIYNLNRIAGPHLQIITPTYYSKKCPTTGLFVFLIKDFLEYAGVIQPKKKVVARMYRNLLYRVNHLQDQINKLN